MNKKLTIILFLLLLLTILSGFNSSLLNCQSFKVTIFTDEKEIEWEYINPNEYELEQGSIVIKGDEAKKEVTKLYYQLKLTEKTTIEGIMESMKQSGYKNFSKIDVRWINEKGELYTWVWNEKEN